jgi:hydrogenase-4 component F
VAPRRGLLNATASSATFLVALVMFVGRPEPTTLLFIDDFNVYLVVLTSFVGCTAAWFSASYIEHEVEIGRLTPTSLRFYHAMYQG